jgi:hypothetical protein
MPPPRPWFREPGHTCRHCVAYLDVGLGAAVGSVRGQAALSIFFLAHGLSWVSSGAAVWLHARVAYWTPAPLPRMIMNLGVMIYLSWENALITLSAMALLCIYLMFTAPPVPWGVVSNEILFHQVRSWHSRLLGSVCAAEALAHHAAVGHWAQIRKYLLRLDHKHSSSSAKFWKPNLLVVALPGNNAPLLRRCNELKKGGLLVVAQVRPLVPLSISGVEIAAAGPMPSIPCHRLVIGRERASCHLHARCRAALRAVDAEDQIPEAQGMCRRRVEHGPIRLLRLPCWGSRRGVQALFQPVYAATGSEGYRTLVAGTGLGALTVNTGLLAGAFLGCGAVLPARWDPWWSCLLQWLCPCPRFARSWTRAPMAPTCPTGAGVANGRCTALLA